MRGKGILMCPVQGMRFGGLASTACKSKVTRTGTQNHACR